MAKNHEVRNLPTANSDEESTGALGVLSEFFSGIPKVFQKPLAKAISRLARGAVEWPAAAFEAQAAEVQHKQAMREKVRAAIVKQAISQISEKPDIADRAIEHFASDILGKQYNREQVLLHAAEELSQVPPPDDSEESRSEESELDDDWLSAIARHAENATSERLQQIFGRVLAGEIKRPGAYSLFTLDLLSKLSEKDAKVIVSIAPYVIGNGIYLTPTARKALNFATTTHLVSIGIMPSTANELIPAVRTLVFNRNNILDGQPSFIIALRKHVLLLRSPTEQQIQFDAALLTSVGEEVLSLHYTDISEEFLKELSAMLDKKGVSLMIADIVLKDGLRVTWRNGRIISPQITDNND